MSPWIAQWLYKNGMRRWRMHICLVMISEFQMACRYNPRYMWLLVQLLNRSPPPQTKCNYAHLCRRTQDGTVTDFQEGGLPEQTRFHRGLWRYRSEWYVLGRRLRGQKRKSCNHKSNERKQAEQAFHPHQTHQKSLRDVSLKQTGSWLLTFRKYI